MFGSGQRQTQRPGLEHYQAQSRLGLTITRLNALSLGRVCVLKNLYREFFLIQCFFGKDILMKSLVHH
jgi:hypothetical protein